MRRHIKPIIAFAVALMLAGCNDTLNGDTWNERENLLISGGLKALANSALKRDCMSGEERGALYSLNGILERRGSTHRIVMWKLPTSTCRGD